MHPLGTAAICTANTDRVLHYILHFFLFLYVFRHSYHFASRLMALMTFISCNDFGKPRRERKDRLRLILRRWRSMARYQRVDFISGLWGFDIHIHFMTTPRHLIHQHTLAVIVSSRSKPTRTRYSTILCFPYSILQAPSFLLHFAG